jgi:hypothetical protein
MTLAAALPTAPSPAQPEYTYMYIFGHPTLPKQQTEIGSSTQPVEALRQYNNMLRSARSATLCVLICVPAWRRLDVRELLQLWHRSRKLNCRMRFGINMAYDLRLPCFVAESALATGEARKTLPHIAARCTANTSSAQTSDGAAGSSLRRRGRRPSARDTAVANHVRLCDMTIERIGQIVASTRVPSEPTMLAMLDQYNTLAYQKSTTCFTIGAPTATNNHRILPSSSTTAGKKRALRQSTSSTIATTTSSTTIVTRDDGDDNDSEALDEEFAPSDDEDDNDDAGDDDDDEDDEPRRPRKKRRRTTPKTPTSSMMSSTAAAASQQSSTTTLAATALQNAEARELQMQFTTTNSSALASLTNNKSLLSSTAVSVAQTARAECSIAGALDNRLLVERVDDCYKDALEFRARPMKRVHLHRLHRCVCGARNSFGANGVCSNCYATKHSARMYRTDVVRVKEQVLQQPSRPDDRRELKRLLLATEADSPIEAFSRVTLEQTREAFPHKSRRSETSQQQHHHQQQPPPKESRLIAKLLQRALK